VTLARDPRTKENLAVKHISVAREQFYLLQEVETLVKLNHPCVVRIYAWALPEGSTAAEIQMEYAENKSLKDVLHKMSLGVTPGFWNPTGIGIIICGLVLGMRFVHSRGIKVQAKMYMTIEHQRKRERFTMRHRNNLRKVRFALTNVTYSRLGWSCTKSLPENQFSIPSENRLFACSGDCALVICRPFRVSGAN
jgi:serine/threonine protein kinase